ncbi:hypothetical protein EDD85DRAFT_794074 [Armillaria nabsnona]|nr:hypothetical protein EDD85DRAFT_794074 [Armillaria nabsnona]
MTPHGESGSQDTVGGNGTGTPTGDERERTNSTGMPLHLDTSESQSPRQWEALQAALGDVVAKVLRLRTQVQQIIEEWEAGRVQSNALDRLPESSYFHNDGTALKLASPFQWELSGSSAELE